MANGDNQQYLDFMSSLMSSTQGGPNYLTALAEAMKRAMPPEYTDRRLDLDPFVHAEQFREQEYGPRASGVPYIFTGGSVFPQTKAQRRAEEMATRNAFLANMLDTIGSAVRAWRSRRSGGPRGV